MKHKTTLTRKQREILIHTLSHFNDIKELAVMTDVQLHSKWLDECKKFVKWKLQSQKRSLVL